MEYAGEDNLDVMEEAFNYNNYIVDMLVSEVNQAQKIVDFGAGKGTFAEELELRLHKEIMAIEPAENLQKLCFNKGLKVLNSLDKIEEDSVDFLYSLSVLEHIENDKEMIEKIYGKLNKSGKVFIFVPAFQCLFSAMDKKVGHYRRYSKSSLKELFDKNWQIEKLCYFDSIGFFASIWIKYMGSKKGNINPKMLKFYDKVIFPISIRLDRLIARRFLGKNLILIASKKSW